MARRVRQLGFTLRGLALLVALPGCETAEPAAASAKPPVVVPECEYELRQLAPEDEIGPYSAREFAEQLSGDYRILITWSHTGEQQEVPFSLAVEADSTTRKEPTNAECYKPLIFLIPYEFMEDGSVASDDFVVTPARDNFPRMRHSIRTALVPSSVFPPEVTAADFTEGGWRLDRIELGARWHPDIEQTVAQGKIMAWYVRSDGESTLTSTLLGLAAIYPEASFSSPSKETPNDPDEE